MIVDRRITRFFPYLSSQALIQINHAQMELKKLELQLEMIVDRRITRFFPYLSSQALIQINHA